MLCANNSEQNIDLLKNRKFFQPVKRDGSAFSIQSCADTYETVIETPKQSLAQTIGSKLHA